MLGLASLYLLYVRQKVYFTLLESVIIVQMMALSLWCNICQNLEPILRKIHTFCLFHMLRVCEQISNSSFLGYIPFIVEMQRCLMLKINVLQQRLLLDRILL